MTLVALDLLFLQFSNESFYCGYSVDAALYIGCVGGKGREWTLGLEDLEHKLDAIARDRRSPTYNGLT